MGVLRLDPNFTATRISPEWQEVLRQTLPGERKAGKQLQRRMKGIVDSKVFLVHDVA